MWPVKEEDLNQSLARYCPGAWPGEDHEKIFNSDGVDFELLDLFHLISSSRLILLFVYTTVFCFCVFGNLAVLLVVSLHWRMRSHTKFCIRNLAFANILVGIFCVYQNLSTFLTDRWVFGLIMCKMYHFINSLGCTASVLIHVVISAERYLAILHPFPCRRILSITRIRIAILIVWVLSALFSAPRLYYTTQKITNSNHGDRFAYDEICERQPNMFDNPTADLINFIVLFLLPLTIIVLLYARVGIFLWHTATVQQTKFPSFKCSENICSLDISSSSEESATCACANVKRTARSRSEPSHRYSLSALAHFGKQSSPDETAETLENKETVTVEKFDSARVQKKRILNNRDCPKTLTKEDKLDCSVEFPVCTNNKLGETSAPGIDLVARTVTAPFLETKITKSGIVIKNVHSSVASYSNKFWHPPNGAITRLVTPRRTELSKPRQVVLGMLVTIVITFAICNLPYHLRKVIENYLPNFNIAITSYFSNTFSALTSLLMYANCAINPILYLLMSKMFRASLKDLLTCKLRRSRHRPDSNVF